MSFSEFFVPGIPKPGGSKRAFPIRNKAGTFIKMGVADASKDVQNWRNAVVDACRKVFLGPPTIQPLILSIRFTMPYRKGDFNTKGEVKPSAPKWHSKKPDCTKLIRSTEDALTGVLWHDDSQVVGITATKEFGLTPGALIKVYLA